MSERQECKCPCAICFAIVLIVTGIKLLSRELKHTKTE